MILGREARDFCVPERGLGRFPDCEPNFSRCFELGFWPGAASRGGEEGARFLVGALGREGRRCTGSAGSERPGRVGVARLREEISAGESGRQWADLSAPSWIVPIRIRSSLSTS